MPTCFMNNLECRKQKFNGKFICKITGKEINLKECYSCNVKKYKKKNIKVYKKSSKITNLEKNRFSLFTDDLDHCIFCGAKRDNLHEVIFGKNRTNSMRYGIVIPVCIKHHLECHKNSQLQHIWKVKSQEAFEKAYPDLDFIKIFGKSYK